MIRLYNLTNRTAYKLQIKSSKMDKVKAFFNENIVQTALWIGGSAAVMAVCAYLLQRPELVAYYGVLNFIVYALKDINDKRKAK